MDCIYVEIKHFKANSGATVVNNILYWQYSVVQVLFTYANDRLCWWRRFLVASLDINIMASWWPIVSWWLLKCHQHGTKSLSTLTRKPWFGLTFNPLPHLLEITGSSYILNSYSESLKTHRSTSNSILQFIYNIYYSILNDTFSICDS